ncbi:integrase [Hydrogenophaga palleronii]|uniref:Integrase n=1 Tax=Hydrogenophaga palleronii TaxID=65655 RepID=A0ABU1WUA2_9BURK|nr:site-specific integrase [Hydrogenophaga palleronii]MDR7152886.1 integrase [Hydrogenophaga palleronii]
MSKKTTKKEGVSSQQEEDLQLKVNGGDAVWRLRLDSAARAARFCSFVQQLPDHWSTVSDEVCAVLCVLGYECVLTRQDLLGLLASSGQQKTIPHAVRVTWEQKCGKNSRFESRCLSARTVLALKKTSSFIDWPNAISSTEQHLEMVYPFLVQPPPTVVLEEVLLDASAWHYLHLPACLYSHIRGAISMPSLPNTVLDRLNAKDDLEQGTTDAELDPHSELPGAAEVERVQDASMDLLLDPPSNGAPVFPKKSIGLLKSLCAVSSNDAGIRLSTHLARASTQTKLTLATNILTGEGWVGATLAAWVAHLLHHGSIRKENPAVSTLSAYVGELLEPLANALIRMNKPPILMMQEDWVELFESLAQEGTQLRGASLSALHLWAIRSFGCDPMPQIMFAQNGPSHHVRGNVVWPAEQARAIQLAASASFDERVNAQCTVMLILGCTGLFRISELPSLRTTDIQATREGVRVAIDPSRETHGGKSRAARRVVYLNEVEALRYILDFRDRRNMESNFDPSEPVHLFGDPNKPQKLYQFGLCTRMTNQILRACTGDESVSFHSLRHTSASDRCIQLLTEPLAPTAIAPLHILLHEMGHASPTTLWSTYFHFSDFAIRDRIDKVAEVRQMNSTEVGFWLQEPSSTLRQQLQRGSEGDAAGFYLKRIDRAAFGPDSNAHRPAQPYGLSMTPTPEPSSATQIDYEWILKGLSAIVSDLPSSAICSRLSCTSEHVKRLCLSIQQSLQALRLQRRHKLSSLLLDTADVDHCVRWAREQLDRQGWSFQTSRSEGIRRLHRHLKDHADKSFPAARAWCVMYSNAVLSLEDSIAIISFLRTLRDAGFPPQGLVVRVQTLASDVPQLQHEQHIRGAITAINAITIEALGTDVRIEQVRPRRGYPKRYLLAGRTAFRGGGAAASAAICMRELHGILFGLHVLHNITKWENP